MGARGPVPYRTEELSRPRDANRKTAEGTRPDVKRGMLKPATPYQPDEEWHPTAIRLYEAAIESGQAEFFQQSDWALLYSACEDISAMKMMQEKTGKPHAEQMKALYGVLSTLMFAEADRRRLRIELMGEEDDSESYGEAAVQGYRERLRAVK